ncbi:hypothetical protein [Demequina litorisediminis]|uniref:DUF2178 domain-containing protein n=1 Tax=Demequina litorisediminis TaxID=1849022 RepID=A0ABQ6ICL7_9MICO|nr:hypothetical protein [Demequina litorisediminis]GMA34473.1 hypothetical protein GCM10025876_06770 [Demequina litorisediminis]
MSPDAKPAPLIAKIAGATAAVAAVTAIALVAYATGNDSIGKGAIFGGAITLAAIVVLWAVGSRRGLASRTANGLADERDDRILTHAFAHSAFAMGAAAIASLIASFYGLPAAGVAGIVLWAGLVTFIVSAAIQGRRG